MSDSDDAQQANMQDYCEHGRYWECWECEQEREDAARWAAMSWRRKALATGRRWWLLNVKWRLARASDFVRYRVLRRPRRRLNLTAFDDVFKQHYSAEAVQAMAYQESPFLKVLKREAAATHDSDYLYREGIPGSYGGLAAWIPTTGESSAPKFKRIPLEPPDDDDEAA